MGGYVALSWSGHDAGAGKAARVRAHAQAAGWRTLAEDRNFWCGGTGPGMPGVRPFSGTGLVIGDLYDVGHDWGLPAELDDLARARRCVMDGWGRYVLLFRDATGQMCSVLRDPSGAMEAFYWRTGDLTVLASATPDWLMAAAPPAISIDWPRVQMMLERPSEINVGVALLGLEAVRPGEWRDLRTGARQRLWRARDLREDGRRDPREAAQDLRDRLDHCTARLCQDRNPLGIEVSGGLDSAIVAAGLAACGLRPGLCLNSRASQTETDERAFARDVTDRLGLELTCRLRADESLSADLFLSTAGDPRPSQNGRDVFNDRLVAEACAAAGVTTLITGKGGDALFFQMHTPHVFGDLWRRRPLKALTSPVLPQVARWTRTSTWSVLSQTVRQAGLPGFGRSTPGAAKRIQIDAIASGLAYYSPCRRSAVVDMIHPLMAQPLVEWSLRTPVPDLVAGGRDRALARAAFADRLPESIRFRRGKGDYSAYFSRQVAGSLPFLRDWLLEGRLAAQGLVDRDALETRLDADHLRWQGGAPEILALVSMEAWVRRWDARAAQPSPSAPPDPSVSPNHASIRA